VADDTRALIVALEARIGQYERSMRRAQGQTNSAARRIEGRFERMNRGVTQSFRRMSRVATGALGALGVGLGAAAFANLVRGSLQAALALEDTAARVAFTVEQLQELRFAADQNGFSTRTLDLALQRFSRRTGEAAQGTGELFQTIQQLGISLRNADGSMRSSYEILLDYADAIQNAESDQERLRLAFKAFDSEGAQLVTVMAHGRDGVMGFGQAAREAGVVMDRDLVRRGAEANARLREMEQIITTQLQSAVLENTENLMIFVENLGDVAKVAIEAAAAMTQFGRDTATAIGETLQFLRLIPDPERDVIPAQNPRRQGEALAAIAEILSGPSFNAREFETALRDVGYAGATALADEFNAALESGLPFDGLLEDMQARIAEMSASRINLANMFENEQVLAAMEIIRNPFRGLSPPSATSGGPVRPGGGDGIGDAAEITSEQIGQMYAAIAGKLADSEQEFLDFLQTTEDAVAETREASLALAGRELDAQLAIARARGDGELVRSLERELDVRRQIADLTALGVSAEKAEALANQNADALDIAERQGEFREAFRTAFSEGMLAALQGDQEAFQQWIRDGATRGLEQALNNLADLLFDLLSKAGSGVGGGKGGGVGSVLSGVGRFFGFGGGKAAGGPVSPGRFYTVGERGPERFVPDVPGVIVPAQVGQGAASRVNIIQEFHLHAEGAVMTEHLLAEMDAKAANAGALALSQSRADLTEIRRSQSRRF